eukprot:gene6259-10267_t
MKDGIEKAPLVQNQYYPQNEQQMYQQTNQYNNVPLQPQFQPQPVQTVQQPRNNNGEDDLMFSVIILIVGLFFFPLILIGNIMFIKSKNEGAKIIAYISVAIFGIELLTVVCSILFAFISVLLTVGVAVLFFIARIAAFKKEK